MRPGEAGRSRDRGALRWLPQVALALLGGTLVQAWSGGRLALLMAPQFHPLVLGSGLLLGLAAVVSSLRTDPAPCRRPRAALLLVATSLLISLLPPQPSFSLLVANRDAAALEGLAAGFALPPEQRSLVDWVRILRTSPDPRPFEGQAVRIRGFVRHRDGAPPSLAQLVVRCCLADATPVELAVRWPDDKPLPRQDQWLQVIGAMGSRQASDGSEAVVIPQQIQPIARPRQPFSS